MKRRNIYHLQGRAKKAPQYVIYSGNFCNHHKNLAAIARFYSDDHYQNYYILQPKKKENNFFKGLFDLQIKMIIIVKSSI